MNNAPIVTVLDTKGNHRKPGEYLALAEVLGLLQLLVELSSSFNFGHEITIIAVLHDDVEAAPLRKVDFFEANHIRVVKCLKYFCFLDGFLLLISI